MLQIRSLAGIGWEPLAAAFNEAFSDYILPMSITADGLAAMQRRRGYSAEVSFGAFDGDRMVGFVLTCLDGDRAYNSGTGVVPAYRRAGLARRLVDAVIANVVARSYVLEVIETNETAAALYRRLGFVETRRLESWTYPRANTTRPPPAGAAEIAPIDAPELDAIMADADVEPSWQNSVASLRRASEPYIALGDAHSTAIVFPASADLPLLCVRRDARRCGRGIRLLAAAAAHASRPIRIVNLDERARSITTFLEAAGATRFVRQIEMIRELP
jgi:GNAT superfamily N-acetyltransferase